MAPVIYISYCEYVLSLNMAFIGETCCWWLLVDEVVFRLYWHLFYLLVSWNTMGMPYLKTVHFYHTVYLCIVRFSQWTLLANSLRKRDVAFSVRFGLNFYVFWWIAMCYSRWIKWRWGKFFSCYFSLPLSVSFHQRSLLIFISKLLLLEGQAGEAWLSSNIAAVFRKCGTDWQNTSVFRVAEWLAVGMCNGTVNGKSFWTILSFLCQYWLLLTTMCRGDVHDQAPEFL